MKKHESEISALFFDIGNVLLHFDFNRAARKLSSITDRSETEVVRLLVTIVKKTGYELGKTDTEIFVREVTQQLGIRLVHEEFWQIWGDIFTENTEMVAFVRELRRRKPVYLLSNTNEMHVEFFTKKFPFIREFDGHIYSCRERVGKPDRRIYQIALQRAGIEPQQSLFVDDMEENIIAARKAGMNAIHYADQTRAMEKIKQLLAPV